MTTIDTAALAAPFPENQVSWRVQGKPYERNGAFFAMALAYIDARDVMDRLDNVCGPENWQCEYVETPKGRVICRIGIFVNDKWVWKSDGAGETAVEGDKGGISDSLKRAAVAWGIGRYLYRMGSPWVACDVRDTKKTDNFNNKIFAWKKWAENPWDKVKGKPSTPKLPPKQAAPGIYKRPENATTKSVMDALIASVESCNNMASLNNLLGNQSFDSDWSSLDSKDTSKAHEVRKAVDSKKASLGA